MPQPSERLPEVMASDDHDPHLTLFLNDVTDFQTVGNEHIWTYNGKDFELLRTTCSDPKTWWHILLITSIRVTTLGEITCSIYRGLSKKRLDKEFVGRKVNNAQEVKAGVNMNLSEILLSLKRD